MDNKIGILKFNLEEPTSVWSMENALKADAMKMKIDDLYQEVFRQPIKYGNMDGKILSDEDVELIEAIFQKVKDHFDEFLK